MRTAHAALCLVALLGIIMAAPAAAADVTATPRWQGSMQFHQLPFPRSERAQAVWDERACWSDCGSHCTWGLADCVQHDAQGRCLRRADRCDRTCQRACRTSGGPLLNLAN
jgi:hypothetical protein